MKLLTQWAVTSSALILIVLAARFLFRDKLSARARYALWGIVLLRLLVPFQVELPEPVSRSIPVLATNAVREMTPWLEEKMLYAVPTERRPSNRVQPGEPPEYSRTLHSEADREYYSGGVRFDETGTTRYAFMMPASELLLTLWKWGAALCLLVILYSNWGFSIRLDRRRKRLELTGGHRPPLQAAIPVYTVEGLPSPCLFGVFRPAVYITPDAAEDETALRHVLAHELTHYAHKDHIWSALRCLALALHWYNPLVWLAVWLSKQDGELACDEGAVARLGEAERIPYGRTLVDMVAARSLRPGDLLSCSTAMTGGEKSMKQRVAQIVKKPETVKAALFAVIALAALAAVFVFAGRAQEDNTPKNFLSFVDRAIAIRYSPPIHSSQFYPSPITAPDLLAEAKKALSGVATLNDSDPQPDLSPMALIHESRIVLTFEGGEMEYSLLWQNDRTYLFTGSVFQQSLDLQEEEGETAQLVGVSGTLVSEPGVDLITILERLARGQRSQGESYSPVSSGSPELERLQADLDSASSVRYRPPAYSNYFYSEDITDPDLLATLRERLSYLVPLDETDSLPDGEAMIHASRIILNTEAGEITYTLIPWNGYTYVAQGSGDYSLQEGGRTAFLRTQSQSNLAGAISSLARMQELLSQDPYTPISITMAELWGYGPDFVTEHGIRLQGRPGGEDSVTFSGGWRVRGSGTLLLEYKGDETHAGGWMLELREEDWSVMSDQPSVLRRAPTIYGAPGSAWTYELMEPTLFAACLKPRDVVSVTAGDYDLGQEVEMDLPALKDQLTQALYHQFSDQYDREKYGQYAITIQVKGSGMESYYAERELAEEADRLTLSVGSEQDAVCLRHKTFAQNTDASSEFVRSPELYRTIREAGGSTTPRQGPLTREQIDRVNEAFQSTVLMPDGAYGPSEISCFFTSSYDDPTQIDLEEFLMYCPLGEILENDEEAEFRAVIRASEWADSEVEFNSPLDFPTPVHRYPRKEVSLLLNKYAGVSVEDLDWSGCLYLEKYDAFYNFTSDFGPGFFRCAGGQIMEDSVLLWTDTLDDGTRSELTLRSEGGRWLIQSLRLAPMYER